jgi:hypothetical protein
MAVGQETDLARYLAYSRRDLLFSLGKVLTELKGVTQEYYMMKGDEVREKARAYINANPGDNITTRNAYASVAAHEITATLFSVKNDLDQLTIERDFIQLLLGERENNESEWSGQGNLSAQENDS